MITWNETTLRDTTKQLQLIKRLYLCIIGITIVTIIPFVSLFTGIFMAQFGLLGAVIYLQSELRKHYKDGSLRIAIGLLIAAVIIFILQQKLVLSLEDSLIEIGYVVTGMCIYGLNIAAFVMVLISYQRFQEIRNAYTQYWKTGFADQMIPLKPQLKKRTRCYETSAVSGASLISFCMRASGVVAFYFIVMETHWLRPYLLIPFRFVVRLFFDVSKLSERDEILLHVWLNVYLQSIFVILFVIVFRKEIKLGLKRLCMSDWGLIFIGYSISITATVIVRMILHAFKLESPRSGNQGEIDVMQKVSPVLMLLGTVVLAPITEELVFRQGIAEMIYRLGEKFTAGVHKRLQDIVVVASIIISGSIFGFVHVISHGDYIAVFPYLVSGIVYTSFYFISGRNVAVTIGVHMVNNFVATIITL